MFGQGFSDYGVDPGRWGRGTYAPQPESLQQGQSSSMCCFVCTLIHEQLHDHPAASSELPYHPCPGHQTSFSQLMTETVSTVAYGIATQSFRKDWIDSHTSSNMAAVIDIRPVGVFSCQPQTLRLMMPLLVWNYTRVKQACGRSQKRRF